MSVRHLAKPLDWRAAACGVTMTEEDQLPTNREPYVNCPACLTIISRRAEQEVSPREKMRRDWTVACVGGDTELGFTDWLKDQGVGDPTPRLHTPPRMVDDAGLVDGEFIFTDTHLGPGYELEVVPQISGNIELTVRDPKDGHMFTLHHLDVADMLRALLHDFHYSPERGGPADDHV